MWKEEAQAKVPVPHESGWGESDSPHEQERATAESVKKEAQAKVPVLQKHSADAGTQPGAAVLHGDGLKKRSTDECAGCSR